MIADALFLKEGEGGDTPYPPRDGCKVKPLIEAAEMYPVLEREILNAENSVWIAFRVFDPTTKLRSDEAKAAGHEIWADLIEASVKRGVEVRILLTDFEPVLADYLHAESWASFRVFKDRMDGLPDEVRRRFQMIVIQHEGEIGWTWRQLLRLNLRKRIRRKISKLLGRHKDDEEVFHTRPGLWRWLGWDGDKPNRWKPGPPPRLWPATYHQKCAIIDNRCAILGGLDLDERRWDDARHRQRADETWHDVSSRVEGRIACDAADHFVTLWNEELPRFREIVGEWTNGAGRQLDLDPLDEIERCEWEGQPVGEARCQLLRTRSRYSGSTFAMGPVPHIRELEEAHKRIILGARRCLYIEAQFFRSTKAAKWVIEALRRNPGLEVIILIANVPEEIAFEGQKRHPVHKHGEYLQARALGRIFKAGGKDRVGLFSIAKQEKANGKERRYENSRGTAFGSGVIHIHAKLLIADTDACLLSSANINGRSFEWDTELGYLWTEAGDAIAQFRRRLWRQLFDGDVGEGACLAEWRQVAEQNRTAEPGARQGFVIPYQRGRARRYGNPYFWIPDRLV
ncbi:phospholipase D family protein [uncultured Parasphingopyxis sp.]|uniref:phospholipase D family protein n=1 Tax=uncultured Parasphingopyxis sp. TaxID=1547918 RepID=UPI00260FE623|nr:phospholipase D family protein [uncultured Parasphingopyxis sp.]